MMFKIFKSRSKLATPSHWEQSISMSASRVCAGKQSFLGWLWLFDPPLPIDSPSSTAEARTAGTTVPEDLMKCLTQ